MTVQPDYPEGDSPPPPSDAELDRTTLFAWGDGAALAGLVAAMHPELVGALILYEPALATSSELLADGWSSRDLDAMWKVVRQGWGLPDASGALLDTYVFGKVGPLREDPNFLRWFADFCAATATADRAIEAGQIWLETDVRYAVSEIRTPTTILYRATGDMAQLSAAREEALDLASLVPGATVGPPLPGNEWAPFLGDVDAVAEAVIRHHELAVDDDDDVDRVLATLLFTDIVGSTARAAKVGDRAWRRTLEQHHKIVRDVLARFRGVEVDVAGDGFLARFDTPARALRSAHTIVEAVRAIDLEVRAGIHCGEVELVPDGIRGIAVHTAARICATAGPSEVLLSRTIKDLIAGSGFVLEDRGEQRLKGVPDTWHLYALASPKT